MNKPSLGQYYTDQQIGGIIASNFLCANPNVLLELGAGQGNLIGAVKRRWNEIKVISAEIDHKNHASVKRLYPDDQHHRGNVINERLSRKLGVEALSIDIAVCNPPYLPLSLSEKVERILHVAGFNLSSANRGAVTADLVFLAQNMRILKVGGELGIILPDNYLSGHVYEWVREILVKEHCISAVIDLPKKIFTGTEAKTHILMLKKGLNGNTAEIPLTKITSDYQVEGELFIDRSTAIYRMDYDYHKWKSAASRASKNKISLANIKAEIKRGTLSRKECLAQNLEHFHTTNFRKSAKKNLYFCASKQKEYVGSRARSGDILFARVGKRCLGQVAIVRRGQSIITDCVYKITVARKYREKVYRALISKAGREWIAAHSHGVCSKVISKRDLMNFEFVE